MKTQQSTVTQPAAVAGAVRLQRKCACGTHTVGGGACGACADKEATLQRSAGRGRAGAAAIPPVVDEVLRSPGQPLDAATRSYMEPRFGHDFSRVRVHTDARAAESAEAVNALAYTVGQNVVFGAGYYRPTSVEGQRLLAHELTHVVQQKSGPAFQGRLTVSEANNPFEAEADRAAAAVLDDRAPAISGRQPASLVQRQPKPTAPTPASPGSPSCTPRTGMTEYGCYCGAGSSCGSGLNCTPANPLDACCQQHDIDYGGCTYADRFGGPLTRCYWRTRAADLRLCLCAGGLSGLSGATQAYRLGVMALFCPPYLAQGGTPPAGAGDTAVAATLPSGGAQPDGAGVA